MAPEKKTTSTPESSALKVNKKATPEHREQIVQIFDLSRIFRLKNVIAEKNGHLHMLKNEYGSGGVSFTEAKRVNAALVNFKSKDGRILQSKINADNVQKLYKSLLPIREMIENRGIVRLFPSPMFNMLSESKNIIKAHKKANPGLDPIAPPDAWNISVDSRKHRTLNWKEIQVLDKVSTQLYKSFTKETKNQIAEQRLEKPEGKMPEDRFGTDIDDENTHGLGQ